MQAREERPRHRRAGLVGPGLGEDAELALAAVVLAVAVTVTVVLLASGRADPATGTGDLPVVDDLCAEVDLGLPC
ncbi:hypothetical protein ACI8AF_16785 [Blastococcus sp. SYSU D00669]